MIKYAKMREEFIGHVNALSDKQYQENSWVNSVTNEDVIHDEMDYAIHFIYDDTCLADDPMRAIGWFLVDESEANCSRELIAALNTVFDKYGTKEDDAFYINSPEWELVLNCAKKLKELLARNEEGGG